MFLKQHIVFVVVAIFSTPLWASEFPFLGQTVSPNVNVRAGQNKNFEVLCQLEKEAKVVVTDKSYNWYKIKLPQGAKSYVSDQYVEVLREGVGRIKGSRVNVRAGPDANRTILGQIEGGQDVHLLEKLEGWYKIEPIEESYGWIEESLLVFYSKYEPNQNLSLTPADHDSPLALEGVLHKSTDVAAVDTIYTLILENQKIYYLQCPSVLLDSFVMHKVKVQGVLSQQAEKTPVSPVVIVSKIELVL